MHVLTRERQADAEETARNASADHLSAELLAALKKGDLSAPALFAPQVPDYSAAVPSKRHQTVGELMLSEVAGTVDFDALLKMVCQMAYSIEPGFVLAAQARTLLKNIAADFGDDNANGETQ